MTATRFTIIVAGSRSTLFGPFENEPERETMIGFRMYEYPSAIALRLDVRKGGLFLREHEPFRPAPHDSPTIILFNPGNEP